MKKEKLYKKKINTMERKNKEEKKKMKSRKVYIF